MNKGRNAVFFSPYSLIWPHSIAELSIAAKSSKSLDSVTFLRCDGIFQKSCSLHSAFRGSLNLDIESRKSLCSKCIAIHKSIDSVSGYEQSYLSDYFDSDILEIIDSRLEETDFQTLQDFSYRNIPVGRLASYDFLIKYKLTESTIPPQLLPELKNRIRECLIILHIAEAYFSKNCPDFVITYNRLYSLNAVFLAVAESVNVHTYSLEYSGPLNDIEERIRIDSNAHQVLEENRSIEWLHFSKLPLRRKEVAKVREHLSSLLNGSSPWVYSAPYLKSFEKNYIRNYFGISSFQKVVLVTLSSADELFALDFISGQSALKSYFDLQIDWISKILESAKLLPDHFFIFRPHPREFPNQRENLESTNGKRLYEWVSRLKLPSNTAFNWPSQNLSLYNFLEETNVLINSTSTVGCEFAAFGIPSLIQNAVSLKAYPPDISFEYTEYIPLEEQLLRCRIDFDRSNSQVIAFRWFYFKYFRSTTISRPYYSKYFWNLFTYFLKLQVKFSRLQHIFSHILKSYFRLISKIQPKLNPVSIVLVKHLLKFESKILYKEYSSRDLEREFFLIKKAINKLKSGSNLVP